MDELEITCDCCGELFFEDELTDGECETCIGKEEENDFFSDDELAQYNGFLSMQSSYEQ